MEKEIITTFDLTDSISKVFSNSELKGFILNSLKGYEIFNKDGKRLDLNRRIINKNSAINRLLRQII